MKEVMMRLKVINYKQSSELSIIMIKEELNNSILIRVFNIKVIKNNKSASFSLSSNIYNRKWIKKMMKNMSLLKEIAEFNLKA